MLFKVDKDGTMGVVLDGEIEADIFEEYYAEDNEGEDEENSEVIKQYVFETFANVISQNPAITKEKAIESTFIKLIGEMAGDSSKMQGLRGFMREIKALDDDGFAELKELILGDDAQ